MEPTFKKYSSGPFPPFVNPAGDALTTAKCNPPRLDERTFTFHATFWCRSEERERPSESDGDGWDDGDDSGA